MIVSGISGDGLVQTAATLIVGVVFFVILRQAIAPNRPVTRTFVVLMLLPVVCWAVAIIAAVGIDAVTLFGPYPTTIAASEAEQLLGERGIRWGLLMLAVGLLLFIPGVAFTAGTAPSEKELHSST
jgi:hypothetical protein